MISVYHPSWLLLEDDYGLETVNNYNQWTLQRSWCIFGYRWKVSNVPKRNKWIIYLRCIVLDSKWFVSGPVSILLEYFSVGEILKTVKKMLIQNAVKNILITAFENLIGGVGLRVNFFQVFRIILGSKTSKARHWSSQVHSSYIVFYYSRPGGRLPGCLEATRVCLSSSGGPELGRVGIYTLFSGWIKSLNWNVWPLTIFVIGLRVIAKSFLLSSFSLFVLLYGGENLLLKILWRLYLFRFILKLSDGRKRGTRLISVKGGRKYEWCLEAQNKIRRYHYGKTCCNTPHLLHTRWGTTILNAKSVGFFHVYYHCILYYYILIRDHFFLRTSIYQQISTYNIYCSH